MMKEIIVVDCQYDFIDGTLACGGAEEAIKNIIEFINKNPDAKIFYSADWHGPEHCSYSKNGGTWPVHCEAGSHGAEIHESFSKNINNPEQKPNEKNIYYKGVENSKEEYSAFDAKNEFGKSINQEIGNEIIVCGIASEFCVRETVLELLKSGRKIEVPAKMLGWVDEKKHIENLKELEKIGVKIS